MKVDICPNCYSRNIVPYGDADFYLCNDCADEGENIDVLQVDWVEADGFYIGDDYSTITVTKAINCDLNTITFIYEWNKPKLQKAVVSRELYEDADPIHFESFKDGTVRFGTFYCKIVGITTHALILERQPTAGDSND